MNKVNKAATLTCIICGIRFHPHSGREESSKFCSIPCYAEYQRANKAYKGQNAIDLIRQSVTIDPVTNCWVWNRSRNYGGYGLIFVNGCRIRAHRFSYETFTGTILDERIPKGTLYNLVYLRRIPFVKRGRSLRFDPDEVLRSMSHFCCSQTGSSTTTGE